MVNEIQEAHTVAAALAMLLLPTFNPSPAVIDSSPLPLLLQQSWLLLLWTAAVAEGEGGTVHVLHCH